MRSFLEYGRLLTPVGVFGCVTTSIGLVALAIALLMERTAVDQGLWLASVGLFALSALYAALVYGFFANRNSSAPIPSPAYRLRAAIFVQNYFGWLVGPGLLFYVMRFFAP